MRCCRSALARVGLKVLHSELAATLGPERFLREIRTAARLQHPHILPLFDSGDAAGLLWYTMPYAEGESLRQRLLRERQLPLDDALRLAAQVLSALGSAHAHGVIHRDIKPENILLEGGEAVVSDFGVARAISAAGEDRLTETGLVLGTPAYMSPEQAAASKELDGRSDLYAMGCVLYEMLAGHPPFLGATAQQILARHAMDPVPSLRTVRGTVPEAIERCVLRALAKVPADRFPDCRPVCRGAGNRQRGGSHSKPRKKEVAGRRFAGVAALGALLVLAVVASLWWPRRVPELDPDPRRRHSLSRERSSPGSRLPSRRHDRLGGR